MKLKTLASIAFFLAALSMARPGLNAQVTENDDKTLSPYFLVESGDESVERFALESTKADVKIAGVIADVTVTQVYKNDGRKPIEAVYIFPASTRAAVYSMKMTIGERVIVAKIDKKEAAREQYDKAKQEGKSASLLEQQRPNVFQMNVANIMPGDRIEVELKYTELLVPTDAVYEFSYPTVVGPRYSNQPEENAPASEAWVKNPYLHEGEEAPYTFGMNVELSTGLPIRDLTSPSHKVEVNYDGPSVASIRLDRSEKDGGNRDFILRYRLAGGEVESGLMLYKGEKENFFLLMMQPPERVKTAQIPPREYIFIVDVSGSMHGFPLEISKKLMGDLIGNLRRTDTFNVLLFAGGSTLMSEKSLPATRENVQKAITVIDNQQGGGGTELLPALKRALALPETEGVSRTIVIVTDGYVSVEKEAFDLIRNSLGRANMFAFGIGSSVNRFLIEGMARAGMGEPFVVTEPGEAGKEAESFRKMIQSPALTDININYGDFDVYDVEPPSVPDVLAERPVVVFGKWRGRPEGRITLTGLGGEGKYKEKFEVDKVEPLESNSALRYLWARHRIAVLDDYNKLAKDDERVKEVTSLGLTYNLLTAYTSFVAIDSEVRNKTGDLTTIKQPLPLPQGVSDYAVGGASGTMAYRAAPMKSMGYPGAGGPVSLEAPPPPREKAKEQDEAEETKAVGISLSVARVTVDGDLSEKDARKVVETELDSIRRCMVAHSLGFNPPSGKIRIELYVDSSGKVSKVKLIQNGTSQDMADCVTDSAKEWKFKKTADGQAARITIELELK